MIKFENVEVVGWEHAIRGMRNPKNSWDKSDSHACPAAGHEQCGYMEMCEFGDCYEVGKNDLDLMMRLRNAGTDHRKFMRMIVVYADITAPLYWWKEFDTYKVGTVANSCSTMHKIHAKEFTLDDFSHEHMFDIDNADISNNDLFNAIEYECGDLVYYEDWDTIEVLKVTIKALNFYRAKFLETKDKKYWWQMIQLLPTSYNQKRTVMMNYEVLANIYKPGSRKYHKQDEWNVDCEGSFCKWIESLPYPELITGE